MTDINHNDREHAFLSASASKRWLHCPASAVAETLYPDTSSPAALEGTIAHEVAEIYARHLILGEPLRELPEGANEDMVEHAKGYCDFLKARLTTPEAFLLLENRVDFSHIVPEGFGTADAIIVDGCKLVIIDYKYGFVEVSATENSQMRLYATGALAMWARAFNIAVIEMCIYQPRLNRVSVEIIPVEELTAWAEEIKPLAALAAKGEGGYIPGDHCRYCAHAARCPGFSGLVHETAKNLEGCEVDVLSVPPDVVARLLAVEPVVTATLKRVKEYAINAILDNPCSIPGWKVVEGKSGKRNWTDEAAAIQTLSDAGLDPVSMVDVKLKSPAQIEKVFGKKVVGDLVRELCSSAPGAPTLATLDDPRPAIYTISAAEADFC